jgi:radical SAM superfamily enzyme YgiQ (UPF0313 family)
MALRVLFVYPLCPPRPQVYPGYHHGIGHLAAVLKARGHLPSLLATHTCRDEEVKKVLTREEPDIIAVTSTTAEFPLARQLIETILGWRRLPVFVGGVHATVAPEEVASIRGIRGLCRGEGEEGFVQVVDSLELGDLDETVPGFWFRSEGEWIRNPTGLPTPLTGLAFADREIFGYEQWARPFRKIIGAEFLAGRGCPFRCTYCCTPLYNDLYKPYPYPRRRPVEEVLSEVNTVLARYPSLHRVGFHDDIFTLDKGWLAAFCEQYPKVVGRPFWCNTRVGCVTAPEAEALRKAGCFRVHVAIEAGSPWLRKEILNRDISDEQILETFSFLKKAGLKRMAFNMLGLPFETEETIRQTIALNRKIRPDRVHVTLFQPYPGTALFRLCEEEELLEAGAVGDYYGEATRVKNASLENSVLYKYLRDFVSLVYSAEALV